jgi:hypothetical protein
MACTRQTTRLCTRGQSCVILGRAVRGRDEGEGEGGGGGGADNHGGGACRVKVSIVLPDAYARRWGSYRVCHDKKECYPCWFLGLSANCA